MKFFVTACLLLSAAPAFASSLTCQMLSEDGKTQTQTVALTGEESQVSLVQGNANLIAWVKHQDGYKGTSTEDRIFILVRDARTDIARSSALSAINLQVFASTGVVDLSCQVAR